MASYLSPIMLNKYGNSGTSGGLNGSALERRKDLRVKILRSILKHNKNEKVINDGK